MSEGYGVGDCRPAGAHRLGRVVSASPVALDERPSTRRALGTLAPLLLSSVLFGISATFVSLAYDHGANEAAVLVTRGLATLPWLALLASGRHRAQALGAWRPLLAMSVLLATAVSLFFVALSTTSPALAFLVFYVYPALVIAGAHLLGWNRFDRLTAIAAGTTFAGVAITVGLPGGGLRPLGFALAVLTALAHTGYVLIAQSTLRRVDAVAAMGFVGGVSSVLLLVVWTAVGPETPTTGAALGSLAGLLLAVMFPHVLLLAGIGRVGGPWGSIVACLEVVTGITAAVLILNDPLGTPAIVGGALVLVGGVAAPIVATRRGGVAGRATGRRDRVA
jgi:drug/metabolite transporter (DMT)-like permease